MFDLLGIDWGEKRCGLAFADSQSKLILPANYPCPTEQIWPILDSETKNKPIRQIVVGMPLNFRGQKNQNQSVRGSVFGTTKATLSQITNHNH